MKNIAIMVPSVKAGGAEKQAALLAKCLSERYVVHFIVYHGEMQPSEANISILNRSKHLSIHYLEGCSWKKNKQIYLLLKKNRIEVAFNYLSFCDTYGCLIERLAGVKKIYNGIRNSQLPKGKFLIEKLFHNKVATGTIFNSHTGSIYFQKNGFNSKKCIVIPNCFPEISFQTKKRPKEIVDIITVGRFVKQKDYETAIKSISLINSDKFHFTIVGYGELEELIKYWIIKYGIQNITTVHINPNNTQELLKNADIYLSTSIFEGTSNSIMEALNWNLPVVATDVGDNKYLVKSGESGFLHATSDAKGIAQSLITLLNDIELRNEMGARGHRILQDNYSIELFKQRYINLIDQ